MAADKSPVKLIIDCHGLGYKFVYSMPELTFKQSKTSVIFGFLGQLRILAEKFQTNQFIFCWDSRHSYRKIDCSSYKLKDISSEKKELIAHAHTQFDQLRKDILPAMGFKNHYIQTGYEADDLIAHIVYRFPNKHIIVSKDKDLLQLLSEERSQYCFIRIYNYENMVTAHDFTKKYGIEPRQWIEVKAMAGCASDKIDGIPGVGEDSAIKYLNNVLSKGKILDKIESDQGKKIISECRNLVSLPYLGDTPINISYPVEDEFQSLDFIDTFNKYGCYSYVDNFEKWAEAFKITIARKRRG
jgi:5'-3' exonuclease